MKNDLSGNMLIGLALSIFGLIIISMNTIVAFNWHYFNVFSMNVSGGLILIPLFASIIMLVSMENKLYGRILLVISVIALLIVLILSINLHIKTTNLFNLLLMFAPFLVGLGLIIKETFNTK